ncbi:MAG TPA: prolipoprotein diacylglyceryl transferase family protein [Kofleriaceae bacterium]|nr:prolipoprotein diacylglyceryl transferase family protein [Kofleriaceae bacterium]
MLAASFPYIDLPTNIGPINLFGILLAVGVLFGSWMARKYCERNGLDEETLRWFGIRLIVWGFIGSFVLNTVFYEWHAFADDPWDVTKKLGISSYGAVVSGGIAFMVYSHLKKLDRRKWADMAAWGAAGGWLFGRLGCAVVHDHPGFKSDFPLAVEFPPKKYPLEKVNEVITAHDLGLYEFFLWCFIIVLLVVLERWKGRRPGFLLGIMAVVYSIPRFLFEFLRPAETDPRYAGLTFAQWASIAAFIIGLWLLFGPIKNRNEPLPEAVATETRPKKKPAAQPARKKKKK